MASRVAGWIRDRRDALWIAPRSRPPITPQTLIEWGGPGKQQFVLCDDRSERSSAGAVLEAPEPVAYGELNLLDRTRGVYWLGHIVVDPARRGMGIGVELTTALLQRAFARHGAQRVCLVVFRDNHAAISCYTRAGLRAEGFEDQFVLSLNRWESFLRMSITRPVWQARESQRPVLTG